MGIGNWSEDIVLVDLPPELRIPIECQHAVPLILLNLESCAIFAPDSQNLDMALTGASCSENHILHEKTEVTANHQPVFALLRGARQDLRSYTPCLSDLVKSVPRVSG